MRKPNKSLLFTFILFLIQPEDSSITATSRWKDRQLDRFDNQLAGTFKIAFWIGAVILFWIAVPALCGYLKGQL
jgi:hypothetical protein